MAEDLATVIGISDNVLAPQLARSQLLHSTEDAAQAQFFRCKAEGEDAFFVSTHKFAGGPCGLRAGIVTGRTGRHVEGPAYQARFVI
jgi:seryl-tRNA(Sec) selenium transferase